MKKIMLLVLCGLTSLMMMSCMMPNMTSEMTPKVNVLEVKSIDVGNGAEICFDENHIFFRRNGKTCEVLDIVHSKSNSSQIVSSINVEANIHWIIFYTNLEKYHGNCMLISSVHEPGHNEYNEDGSVLYDTLVIREEVPLSALTMKY